MNCVARIGQRYPTTYQRNLPPSKTKAILRCAAKVALIVILGMLLLSGFLLVVH